jgi:hypothetical protein
MLNVVAKALIYRYSIEQFCLVQIKNLDNHIGIL